MSAAAAYSTEGVTSWCASTLRHLYGGDAKRLAKDAGSNTDAARNWLQGKNALSLTYFAKLCAIKPELAAEWRRFVQMDAALDPSTEAALVNLVQAVLRRDQRDLENAGE